MKNLCHYFPNFSMSIVLYFSIFKNVTIDKCYVDSSNTTENILDGNSFNETSKKKKITTFYIFYFRLLLLFYFYILNTVNSTFQQSCDNFEASCRGFVRLCSENDTCFSSAFLPRVLMNFKLVMEKNEVIGVS